MTSIISALCAIISVVVFIISVSRPVPVNVGDIYGLTNGGSSDTRSEPMPFVAIYTVKEIKGEEAFIELNYLKYDGTTHRGEHWKRISRIQRFDTKLK